MHRFIILIATASMLFGWGQTGHRVIGTIAEEHLTRKARKEITKLLGHTNLALVSNWADEIKSDPAWDHSHHWHYCTIPAGGSLEPGDTGGAAAEKVEAFIVLLAEGTAPGQEQVEALKFLVHLLADIHQPLHVGNGTDRGGNDVKITWFGEPSNLHRVWDTHLIEHQNLSYTEFAEFISLKLDPNVIGDWQQASVNDILAESQAVHPLVYDIGEGRLSWRYAYQTRDALEEQLLKAGVRLAGILNSIYD